MATIKVDMSGVSKKVQSLKPDKRLGQFMAETAMAGMDPYVPFRDGALSKDARAEPFKITYIAPYAHYIWNGVSKSGKELNISKEKHPKATSHWDEHYAKAHGAELGRAATDYVKRML